MKFIKAFIAGLGIFLVQPAAAQNADPVQVSAFLDLIADNGCSMTEAEAEIIFPANGFDKSLTREIAIALIDQGVVAFESETLRIIDGSCDINSQVTRNIELTADQARFIEILAPLGCRMTEDQMKTTLPENGMSARTGDQMADELMDLGIATVSEDRMSLTISADYCPPVGAAAPAEPDNGMSGANANAMYMSGTQVQRFVEIMAENNCSLHRDQVRSVFTEPGMMPDDMDEIAETLMGLSLAAYSRETQMLTLHESICASNAAPQESNVAPQEPNAAPQEIINDQESVSAGVPLSDPAVHQFVTIMSNEGCMISAGGISRSFDAAGMTEAEAREIGARLETQGFLSVSGSGAFMMMPPNCEAYAPPAAQQAVASESPAPAGNDGSLEGGFMSVMAQNDCRLTEIDARQLFPASGLVMEDAYIIADKLVEAGLGHYSEDNTTLIITSPDCTDLAMAATPVETGSDAPEVVVATPEASDDPEAQFLMMVAANACEITQANARDMTDAAGMDFNLAMGIASRMMNDGRAVSPDGGQTLQILAPLCVAVGSGPAGPMEPRDIFIEVLRGNNCTMTAGEFSSLLPVDGLDQNAAFGLITELEAEGVITLPPTRDVVTLTAGNCR